MDLFRIVVTNLDSKKVQSIHALQNKSWICIVDHESSLKKNRFELWITNPVHFQRFNLFSWIQWILMNLNESLIQHETNIWEFGFANPYGSRFANPQVRTLKIWFVDSFWEKKNPKLLDLFCFGRTHIQILQA